jgi:hypothetical protein
MQRLVIWLMFLIILNSVTAKAANISSSDTLEIITKNYSNSTADSTVYINIDYPQIINSSNSAIIDKVNKLLEYEFMQSVTWFNETIVDSFYLEQSDAILPFTFETGYQIEYNSKGFISLTLDHYQFTGGVHGNYFSVGYNIDMKDGSILTLNDIIVDGSIDMLTYECEESILESYSANSLLEAGLFEDEITLSIDQDFYIIPGAIVLQFDPYEIGPYVMGEIVTEIPFEKIKDILQEELPFTLE